MILVICVLIRRHALRAKEKLIEIWKEPAVRLQQVIAADSDLQTLLAPTVRISTYKLMLILFHTIHTTTGREGLVGHGE